MGSWCDTSSSTHTPCASGTFLNSTMNTDITDCIDCTPGYYCDGTGNIEPDGLCAAGWYCDGGEASATPTGLECTLGKLNFVTSFHRNYALCMSRAQVTI